MTGRERYPLAWIALAWLSLALLGCPSGSDDDAADDDAADDDGGDDDGANNAHGLPLNHILWCETEDSGSLTIPQALVEAFPLGSTPMICVGHDCPPSELIRYRRDQVSVAQGVAEFEVLSRLFFGYDHHQ